MSSGPYADSAAVIALVAANAGVARDALLQAAAMQPAASGHTK